VACRLLNKRVLLLFSEKLPVGNVAECRWNFVPCERSSDGQRVHCDILAVSIRWSTPNKCWSTLADGCYLNKVGDVDRTLSNMETLHYRHYVDRYVVHNVHPGKYIKC